MRADRAYIAGFGTTSLLVGSALLLLATVSVIVGFNWSGGAVGEQIGNLRIGDSARRLAVEGPRRIAAEAAPAAGAVAETPAPGTAAAASAATTPERARTRPQQIATPDGGAISPDEFRLRSDGDLRPAGDRSGDQPRSLVPETPVSGELQRATSGLGVATQGVTDGLGEGVGGLSPPVGETLVDTGQLLSDLLNALGQPRR